MGKIIDKLEGLFIVDRKKTTYKKAFFGLILVIIAGFTMPAYFRYESYVYEKYKEEYSYVADRVKVYKNENGVYPLGEPIDWNKEKNLDKFFVENNFSKNNELRYIDTNLLEELKEKKYTYIIDVETGKIYTSEFVVYNIKRWHFVFY